MKYLLLCALLLIGAVQIHSVYYDAYSEHNSEYVLLTNTGTTDINITGYRISTPSSQQDATLQGIIHAQSTYLVADSGWSSQRDNLSWPQADHEETLTLPNSAGFVQVIDLNETVLDTLGWADTDTYSIQAHPGAAEGNALVRTDNSGNNSADFQETLPEFSNQEEPNATEIVIRINESPPELINYYVNDLSPQSQQIDLEAIPGQDTDVEITLTVQDLNTNEEVNVSVNGHELQANTTAVSANYTGKIPINTQTTSLDIEIRDEQFLEKISLPVQLSESVAISIPEDITLNAVPGSNTTLEIPITNIGTQDANLHIRAKLPRWTNAAIGEITYRLAGNTYTLTDAFTYHEIGLEASETIIMHVHLRAGFVPAKEYIGELYIAAVESQ